MQIISCIQKRAAEYFSRELVEFDRNLSSQNRPANHSCDHLESSEEFLFCSVYYHGAHYRTW
jgi:hypothetical protein